MPAIGVLDEVTQGIFDMGGGLKETLSEWQKQDVSIYVLDAEGETTECISCEKNLGFILSDHLPFTDKENEMVEPYTRVSLGKQWLQGHACITIIQHSLDR